MCYTLLYIVLQNRKLIKKATLILFKNSKKIIETRTLYKITRKFGARINSRLILTISVIHVIIKSANNQFTCHHKFSHDTGVSLNYQIYLPNY